MLTYKQILKDVWGDAHIDDLQYLRVYVNQLRDKIESEMNNNTRYIVTGPGIGYRMECISEPDPIPYIYNYDTNKDEHV
jgi:two-component system KDP operon response regulator KdpE